ncbi:CSC1-like protein HYP1 isoform X1 [Syzygium oleosum]|uniref:CSC1-like protein HYP1 isoform X1 n=1 Tax=Syzygium oleosum TaxID=219896 RepID=UPI0024B990F4|nr:CSC1-like protein HYP1 isoform X1 [Syzygium oleosum]XP_030469461.2 CSC1-like protein HYP1 isoform X1 [Syzygium oleosum]
MILSALLTSVGINLGLCLLFFTLYSILRKQPSNITVYAPRLVAEHKIEQRRQFNLERLLPSPGWVRQAWQPTEEELLSLLGLDAVVFTRVFIFSLRVFSFATIVGIGILLPINYLGTQLSDDSELQNKSLDSFSISNVNDGSNWLWIHFSAAYIFSGVVCYLLYYELSYISDKIIKCFYSCKPLPHDFTVLVRGISTSLGHTVSEDVESFFTEYYPSTYLSHSVVRRTSKLRSLISNADKLYEKLTRVKSNKDTPRRFKRDGPLGLFGRQVDLADHDEKKLEDLEERVRIEQSLLAGQEVPAAFVSFKTRFGAATALHIQQRINPTKWVTEQAPEPQDIHWAFFSASFLRRWISNLAVVAACIAITILFLIPVVIVQGLTNLDQLETWFPFLEGLLKITFISEVITGYLPSLILQLFLSLIPPVMVVLSSMQGYIAFSQIQKSACIKVLWFTIWNIFFANVLSGSALYRVNVFLDLKNIPTVLAEAVPAQASFFIAYVVTSGWTSVSSELFRLLPLIFHVLAKVFARKDAEEFEVPQIPYHSEIPKIIFFGVLGITYFFLAPLILPFLLIYYCMGYIVYRNQLLNVYICKYETSGKFWPIVHSSTIFSLVLMHIIAIGIFGLKNLPLASGLMVPLPVLTLLFNRYCQKRFLPLFKAYPAECLIKKDSEDQNDPTIGEFYNKLATAYEDPAMRPTQYSLSTDSRSTPLLQAAEVENLA